MFFLLILFFIVYLVSFVYIIYKLKLQDDDIEILYDKYAKYIADSFQGGVKNDWYFLEYAKRNFRFN